MPPTPTAILPDLRDRDLRPERMDDPSLPWPAHRRALRGLARIHAVSGTVGRLWAIVRAKDVPAERPLRLLDVGAGGGDVALGLWRRARAAGRPVVVDACDLSGRAVDRLRARWRSTGVEGRCFVWDVTADEPPPAAPAPWDVVLCSLLLHHLSEADATGALRRMHGLLERPGGLLVVDDLVRSRAGWLLAAVGTSVLSRSPIVRADGPQSVRAAFTGPELEDLARRAGLESFERRRSWPARQLLLAAAKDDPS